MLAVQGVAIVGEHGLELAPEAERWAETVAAFARSVDWPAERKPLSLSFHFRRADDEAAARAYLERVAEAAEREGLVPRWGRMVLEVRPPVDGGQGHGRSGARHPRRRRPRAVRRRRHDRPRRLPRPGRSRASRCASPSTPARRRRSSSPRPISSSTARTASWRSSALSGRSSRRRAASRRRMSQAARTSSSVVRALPIARRSTNRPPSRVCERNASPVALTRSRSASFSSSVPSCRKQTSENGRGAQTSQPGSARDPLLEQRREADVLPDHRLQPLTPVAAEDGPQLQRAEPPAERHGVLAQADDVLVDPQVLGDEAERAPQVVGPPREEHRAVHRREEPLVRVDADRVPALPAREQGTELRADRGGAGVGGVDVEPHALGGAAVGERGDRVDRRRGRRPDRRDERAGVGQVDELGPHRERVVAGHRAELELEQPRRLGGRRVRVLGADDHPATRRGGARCRERGDEPARRACPRCGRAARSGSPSRSASQASVTSSSSWSAGEVRQRIPTWFSPAASSSARIPGSEPVEGKYAK